MSRGSARGSNATRARCPREIEEEEKEEEDQGVSGCELVNREDGLLRVTMFVDIECAHLTNTTEQAENITEALGNGLDITQHTTGTALWAWPLSASSQQQQPAAGS
jgi:hypothetical protein